MSMQIQNLVQTSSMDNSLLASANIRHSSFADVVEPLANRDINILPFTPSMARAAAVVMLTVIQAVDGRTCSGSEVLNGDHTIATVPLDCTSLLLNGNSIGDIGATSIAEALKSNTAVTSLDLSYNNIGDVGATSLAESLKVR